MNIREKNGIKYSLDSDGRVDSLYLSGTKVEKELDFFHDNNIKRLYISRYYGFSIDNLNLLKGFNTAEEIFVQDDISDVSGLYYLEKLKKINIAYSQVSIVLENFPLLESAAILWNKKKCDFSMCNNLKYFTIWSFKPKAKNFEGVLFPDNLAELEINFSNISNLKGLNCRKLNKFEGHYFSKLESLDDLEALTPELSCLILGNCKKVSDFSKIRGLAKLKKLILSSCNDITSLEFINDLERLEFFSFVNTKILDGDLSHCKRLNYTGFIDNRSYNYTSDEMKLINSKNNNFQNHHDG